MKNQSKYLEELNEKFFTYLQREDLLETNYIGFNKKMRMHFSEWEQYSKTVFHELDSLCRESPETIANLIYYFFLDKKLLTSILKVASVYSKVSMSRSPYNIVEAIGVSFESAPILRLCAHLLSERKAGLHEMGQNPAILKHFRQLGLSHTDAENIRKIRNCADHKHSLTSDSIILEDDTIISFEACENLLDKYESILMWWMNCIVFSLFYIPRFTILLISSIVKVYEEHGDEMKSYGEGMQIFFADYMKENAKKQQKRKRKKRTFFQPIMRFLVDYSKRLECELRDIADQFSDLEEKRRLYGGAEAIHELHEIFSFEIEQMERDPEYFLDEYFRTR